MQLSVEIKLPSHAVQLVALFVALMFYPDYFHVMCSCLHTSICGAVIPYVLCNWDVSCGVIVETSVVVVLLLKSNYSHVLCSFNATWQDIYFLYVNKLQQRNESMAT